MSREGRNQPIPPFATHGFVDPGPGPVGTTPENPIVVENMERRRRELPLQAYIGQSAYQAVSPAIVISPPLPVTIENEARRQRLPLAQSFIEKGILDSGVGTPGTVPPPPAVVENDDKRARRYRPLDPIVLSGVLSQLGAPPFVKPPAPIIVQTATGPRTLTLPSFGAHGFDDAPPQLPEIIENPRRPYRPQDPIVISGVLGFTLPPFVKPPPVLFVTVDEKGRRVFPQPIVMHGPGYAVALAVFNTLIFDPSNPQRDLVGSPAGAGYDPVGHLSDPTDPALADFDPSNPGLR